MSLSRYAPHRLRARYLRGLNTLPIPAQAPETVEPHLLTVLGRAWISHRPIILGTAADVPRLWLAFTEPEPTLIGYVTGLIAGDPDLWITDESHLDWVNDGDNTAHLKRAATRVWTEAQRDCEG